MGKILVTGASGHIGKLTLQNLLKRKVSASKLAALVRDPSKATDLAALGVEIHQGDYMDPPSLLKVTNEDIFTEKKILASGLKYTFLKHPPYLDTVPPCIGMNALDIGIRVPAGDGKTASATRKDLAEAHAAVLSQDGHENKSYTLTGDPALSFSEMAAILSKILGKKVPLVTVSDQQYIQIGIGSGFPDFVAPFMLGWVKGFNRGEWDNVTGDLERLIGHKPTTTEEHFRSVYLKGASK